MRQSMREANLPDPKFAQKQAGTYQVTVTLENDVEHRRLYVFFFFFFFFFQLYSLRGSGRK